jgi:polyisoprenoid-binding protein YceI
MSKPILNAPRAHTLGAGLAIMLLAAWGFLAGSGAQAARFEITADSPANKVRFDSKATAESFSGVTDAVTGYIVSDPEALGDSATVYVEVDLASLDTGIGLRNKHMRENHLETAKYPKAVLRGVTIRRPAASDAPAAPMTRLSATPQTLEIVGDFKLHGVTRRLRVPVELTYGVEDGKPQVRIVCHFPVALSEYAISRPQFLLFKLSDTQEITFQAVAIAKP